MYVCQGHSIINQRVGDEHEYVKGKYTPKQVWSALIAIFEREGVSNRMCPLREMFQLKMKENDHNTSSKIIFRKNSKYC